MFSKTLALFTVLVVASSVALATDAPQPQAKLSAAEIADRNVAARGGLQAWRAVHTMVMNGNMEAGGNNGPVIPTQVRRGTKATMPPPRPAEQTKLPFTMELKRPMKQRIEIQFNGQTAVQVFDGTNGYKLRPFLNRKDVEPYTPEEMKAVPLQSELDGPLMDYAAKGTKIEFDGVEKVDDRDAYKLRLTLKNSQVVDLWIDAQSFLEVKTTGAPRRLDGKYHPVEIYYRDFRSLGALKVPYLLETKVLNTPGSKTTGTVIEKIVLEKVEVNPPLNDSLFTKGQLEAAAAGVKTVTPASYSHP